VVASPIIGTTSSIDFRTWPDPSSKSMQVGTDTTDMASTHCFPSSHTASPGGTDTFNAMAVTAGGVTVANNRRRDFRKMVLRDGLLTAVVPEVPSRASTYYNSTSARTTIVPPASSVRVVVVDVAAHGVGLRCRHELPVGSCFSMTVPGHPQYDTPRLRIIHTRPGRGNEFEVGAEFC
jgi:hypothetical protein